MATKIDAADRDLCAQVAKVAGFEVLGPVEDFIDKPKEEHIGGYLVRTPAGDFAWNPLKCPRSQAWLASAMKTDAGEDRDADRRTLVQAAALREKGR